VREARERPARSAAMAERWRCWSSESVGFPAVPRDSAVGGWSNRRAGITGGQTRHFSGSLSAGSAGIGRVLALLRSRPFASSSGVSARCFARDIAARRGAHSALAVDGLLRVGVPKLNCRADYFRAAVQVWGKRACRRAGCIRRARESPAVQLTPSPKRRQEAATGKYRAARNAIRTRAPALGQAVSRFLFSYFGAENGRRLQCRGGAHSGRTNWGISPQSWNWRLGEAGLGTGAGSRVLAPRRPRDASVIDCQESSLARGSALACRVGRSVVAACDTSSKADVSRIGADTPGATETGRDIVGASTAARRYHNRWGEFERAPPFAKHARFQAAREPVDDLRVKPRCPADIAAVLLLVSSSARQRARRANQAQPAQR